MNEETAACEVEVQLIYGLFSHYAAEFCIQSFTGCCDRICVLSSCAVKLKHFSNTIVRNLFHVISKENSCVIRSSSSYTFTVKMLITSIKGSGKRRVYHNVLGLIFKYSCSLTWPTYPPGDIQIPDIAYMYNWQT